MRDEIAKQKEKLLNALLQKNNALEVIEIADKAILESSVALNSIGFAEKKNEAKSD